MTRWVALLRGVNVGGHGKVPMAALREACVAAGLSGVRTHLQSGNLVFDAEGAEAEVAGRVRAVVRERFAHDAPVIVRDADALAAVIAACPFPTEGVDPTRLHVVFLDAAPDAARVAALDPDRSPGDRFRVIGREIHLSLPNGGARSKLGLDWFEAKLGANGTARNRRTVLALRESATG